MLEKSYLYNALMCLLLVLCGLVFWWTRDMTPGAELFPRIIASGLAFFVVFELGNMLVKLFGNDNSGATEETSIAMQRSTRFMGIFFVLIVGFVYFLPIAGFEISAIIFMGSAMVLLGGKKALRKWPVAVLVPAMLVLVFRIALNVRLPTIPFIE